MLKDAWSMARRWQGRILLAVVDQGAASTANFLLTILYAVWLPLDSFGRYVIIWSISVLVESAQVSLIMDSMPAIVSRFGRHNRQRLDIAGTWVVVMYGGVTTLLILAAVPIAMVYAPAFAVPLLCLAIVNPFQRLYIFFRRLCYIRDRQDAAALASVSYAVTLLGGVVSLLQLGLLSVESVVLLWGAANGVAALVIQLVGIASFKRTRRAVVVWLIRQLWRSGRWLAGAAVGFWIATWGMFPLIAAMAGTEAAGIVRALQNLFTPIVQFNAALNLAMLPRIADKVVTTGPHYARRFAIYATAAFTAIVTLYAALVLANANGLLWLIYRKPEVTAAVHLLWPLGVAMVLESARQGSSMALLAMNRTRMFFVSRVVGVTVFLAGALLLGHLMGAEGILWATVVSHVFGTGMLMREALRIGITPTGSSPDRHVVSSAKASAKASADPAPGPIVDARQSVANLSA